MSITNTNTTKTNTTKTPFKILSKLIFLFTILIVFNIYIFQPDMYFNKYMIFIYILILFFGWILFLLYFIDFFIIYSNKDFKNNYLLPILKYIYPQTKEFKTKNTTVNSNNSNNSNKLSIEYLISNFTVLFVSFSIIAFFMIFYRRIEVYHHLPSFMQKIFTDFNDILFSINIPTLLIFIIIVIISYVCHVKNKEDTNTKNPFKKPLWWGSLLYKFSRGVGIVLFRFYCYLRDHFIDLFSLSGLKYIYDKINNNVHNLFKEFIDLFNQPYFPIILIVCIFCIIYLMFEFIYPIIIPMFIGNSLSIQKDKIYLNYKTTVDSSKFPKSIFKIKDTQEYSVSLWFYIDSIQQNSQFNNILSIPNHIDIIYNPISSSINVFYYKKSDDKKSDGLYERNVLYKPETQTDTKCKHKKYVISEFKNIDKIKLQKWNHLVINKYRTNTFDIHLNNTQILSKNIGTTSSLFSITKMIIGQKNGLHGGIRNVEFRFNTLGYTQIAFIYLREKWYDETNKYINEKLF